jgi:hypothetical protein
LALIDASGSSLGLATISGDAFRNRVFSGASAGTCWTSCGIPFRRYLSSGFVHGFATLGLRSSDGSGSIYGTSVITAHLVRCRKVSGKITGTSVFLESGPKPIRGFSHLAAFAEIYHIAVPICLRSKPKAFRYGQDIQKGDLAIWLREIGRGPISPFLVTYALFQTLPGDQLIQVGPCERTPVRGNVGEYYAVGVAGAGGQPGRWVIKWRYQVSFMSTIYEEAMEFDVLDTILARIPDVNRVCKRGWY